MQEMTKFYQVCDKLTTSLQNSTNSTESEKIENYLQESINTQCSYVSHFLRTKHQADFYKFALRHFKPGECVTVMDYKIKLELGMRTRENQRNWYGKRGISLHGFYVIAQVLPDQRSAEMIDLWCEDTKQDTWFTQSALDIGFRWLESAFPGFKVYLFSDNGPHHHNTSLLVYLVEVNQCFDVSLVEYNNFEAGEGKTVLHTHFAHISHKIVRWVRVGNDLETGEQLAELVSSIKNTSSFELLIDRGKAPKKMGTLKDISLYGSFTFPLEGDYAGGLVARSLAGVGKEVKTTKVQLQSLSGRTVPLAGATGATIHQQITPTERAETQCTVPATAYSINLVQHVPEPLITANKAREDHYVHKEKQSPEGFAIK
ncbi:uncharacterized protein LOC111347633 isoform X1 [Stylophora pistillata]|uniref:uncharacterized protein LOC111347633 isoform X1 n=1 Tax=Stylophora pistillata TaxID=50429 RepID=UPI000C03E9C6|nr:uncharacterized protein LOC111347633 isoform X1 [Stylophora pistillata]